MLHRNSNWLKERDALFCSSKLYPKTIMGATYPNKIREKVKEVIGLLEIFTMSRVTLSDYKDHVHQPYIKYNHHEHPSTFTFNYSRLSSNILTLYSELNQSPAIKKRVQEFTDTFNSPEKAMGVTEFINDDKPKVDQEEFKEFIASLGKSPELSEAESEDILEFRIVESEASNLEKEHEIDFYDTGARIMPSEKQLKFAKPFIKKHITIANDLITSIQSLEKNEISSLSLKINSVIGIATFQYAFGAVLYRVLDEDVPDTDTKQLVNAFRHRGKKVGEETMRKVAGCISKKKAPQKHTYAIKNAIEILEQAIEQLKKVNTTKSSGSQGAPKS
jgi:hypothetical protein